MIGKRINLIRPNEHTVLLVAGVNVLVDPWFLGDLVFMDQDWLYKGIKRVVGKSAPVPDLAALAAQTDVLVLTQVGARPCVAGRGVRCVLHASNKDVIERRRPSPARRLPCCY